MQRTRCGRFDRCMPGEGVTEKIQAFATLRGWLQTHTKQPRNSQPEGVAHSTYPRREGAHGLSVPSLSGLSFTRLTPLLRAAFSGVRASG